MITPQNDHTTKGAIIGIGLDTKKSYIIRAILESVAYMLKENIELIEKMDIEVSDIRSLGGGAKSTLWCQIKADVNDKNIETIICEESSSLGAAIGIFDNFESACSKVKIRKVYKPDNSNRDKYVEGYKTFTQLYQILKPNFR